MTSSSRSPLRPTFFLLLDAIPYDLAREVWSDGGLPGFAEPRPTVSVFPSLTEVAVPSLLRGIFDAVPPGYEARYYHPPSRTTRGPLGDAETEAAVAPYRARPQGLLAQAAIYLFRSGLSHAQIRWITHRFREEGGPWLGYLSATDGVAHFGGREGLAVAVRYIFGSVDAARRQHESDHGELPGVVLCSDHGMSFGRFEHLAARQLGALLEQAGFRVGDSSPDGVVLVPFGEVGGGAVHTAPASAARVAEAVAGAPGVDVAFARTADGCLAFARRDSLLRARIRWRGDASRYEPVAGDPLGYAPVWRALEEAGHLRDGWASDRELFLASWRHFYPDALVRLRHAFGDLVHYPAAVLFSMKESWTYGPALTHAGATLMGGQIGTHGSLSAAQSLGFAAVTEDGTPPWSDAPALRPEDVFRPWRDLVRLGSAPPTGHAALEDDDPEPA